MVKNKEQIIKAISQDFGPRSPEDIHLDVLSAVSAFRGVAENVETWMKTKKYRAMTPEQTPGRKAVTDLCC